MSLAPKSIILGSISGNLAFTLMLPLSVRGETASLYLKKDLKTEASPFEVADV